MIDTVYKNEISNMFESVNIMGRERVNYETDLGKVERINFFRQHPIDIKSRNIKEVKERPENLELLATKILDFSNMTNRLYVPAGTIFYYVIPGGYSYVNKKKIEYYGHLEPTGKLDILSGEELKDFYKEAGL